MKKLDKKEKFVCEMIWGGVHEDVDYVRNSNLFKEGLKKFDNGDYNNFWDYENKIKNANNV